MSFDFNNYSIKTKVLLPTIVILFSILFTYNFVFSKHFITVKGDAFNDHNILSQLSNQIYNIILERDNISDKQLDALKQSANNHAAYKSIGK
ncbi:MAG: hypothetical protein GY787_12535 [Alteromonadales bacterium]|nr:hypothetical protein [Alteromonadales bacterium]